MIALMEGYESEVQQVSSSKKRIDLIRRNLFGKIPSSQFHQPNTEIVLALYRIPQTNPRSIMIYDVRKATRKSMIAIFLMIS